MVVFVIFYRFTSGTKEKIWNHFWGAAFSAVGWILFSAVFSIYMSITNMFSIYGILGTIIAALLWMYYCIYIMLIGGYLNHVIYTRKFPN
jgi:membrane protein